MKRKQAVVRGQPFQHRLHHIVMERNSGGRSRRQPFAHGPNRMNVVCINYGGIKMTRRVAHPDYYSTPHEFTEME